MLHLFDSFQKGDRSTKSGPVEYLIVGLGNPGRQYENTRHNAGFLALDLIAEKCEVTIDRLKFKSLTSRAVVGGKQVLLMKPQTFMNLSGQAVTEAMAFYKIPIERVIVLFDDISLIPGKLRIRRKGSDGGHNGIKNIIYLTGKNTFPRIKIGVGAKPNSGWNLANWVLSTFSESEQKDLCKALENCYSASELIVSDKIDQAMNLFNS